jgi:hypothetical protein
MKHLGYALLDFLEGGWRPGRLGRSGLVHDCDSDGGIAFRSRKLFVISTGSHVFGADSRLRFRRSSTVFQIEDHNERLARTSDFRLQELPSSVAEEALASADIMRSRLELSVQSQRGRVPGDAPPSQGNGCLLRLRCR